MQVSKVDLGGKLQCENLKNINTIKYKYNAKAESKTLSLIVDSIMKSRKMPLRDAENIPISKNLRHWQKILHLLKSILCNER
ncbi:hypothetical protein OQH61_06655 [Helicobacter sp. MIT 21-1697]|uniref:hypothetical protein n=1 Tax=Helicobacter sp. MIT 21-1697 TaxID=2993733 RepID=UPI00224B33A0|nr:hypothetical protein [Helicobacter sp. MIT 21-1697]MCX2717411.1 hypothetical protein [Helicobacter sp. MIT 21-1697]